MQNINLLDRRLLPAEPLVRAAPAIALLGACALVVLGHGLFEQQRLQRALAAVAEQTPAEAAVAPTGADPGSDVAQLRARLAIREALLAALKSETAQPADPARTVRHVVAALPETMWLTEVELHGARDMRIAGGTLDPMALAEFARRLAASEALRGLGLQTLRLEPEAHMAASGEGPAAPATHLFTLASQSGSDESGGGPR